MEMPLFQKSHLRDHQKWMPIVETWWRKFKVNTYIINTFS